METRSDVAVALGVSLQRLTYVLYGVKERQRYRDFHIPKRSGGERLISAPPKRLLWLQRQLYKVLLPTFQAKPCVHGFVRKKSIVSNASSHLGRKLLLNVDLKDFFPSIHLGRVRGVFKSHPFRFGDEAATVLAQLCCRDDGTLPQGGAMSPLISNLVCRTLDNQLILFAQRHRIHYSRYADDLTFSADHYNFPTGLVDCSSPHPIAGPVLTSIVESQEFSINPAKVRVRTFKRRQEVTGLTVNRFPNVPRVFIRKLEGAIYACEKFGMEAAQAAYEAKVRDQGGIRLENVLRGRLSYLKMVRGEHDHLYRRLARRFNRNTTQVIALPELSELSSNKLQSPTSSWSTWFEKYKSEVFHLLFSTELGEAGGTAFHLGGGLFATVRHNIISPNGSIHSDLRLKIEDAHHPVEVLNVQGLADAHLDVAAVRLSNFADRKGIRTQLRLPQVGEEVAAIGFPQVPQRFPTLVFHVGTVEAITKSYMKGFLSIQVSFHSGGGLSGGCLIDRSGYVIGIMCENVYMSPTPDVPSRPYGQAMPCEYFDDFVNQSGGL